MIQVVKEIYKKTDNEPISFPIGTNGSLVDMKSDLDLEEELKMGGNKITTISEEEKQISVIDGTETIQETVVDTTIKEYYTKKYFPISDLGSSATTALTNYSVFTYVRAHNLEEFPIRVSNQTNTQEEFLVEEEEISNPNTSLIVDLEGLTSADDIIIVHYYGGYRATDTSEDYQNMLHQKVVRIKGLSNTTEEQQGGEG